MNLGVGVVGLGVGEQHARAYDANPGCRLVAVCDLSKTRAQELAKELGADVAHSFDDLLNDPRIHAISIASYDDHHAAQVVAALDAGKHVFCEKPLCHTTAELQAIRDATRRRPNLVLASNLVLRAAPLYAWLRSEISRGRFGEIYAIDGQYLYGRLHKLTEGWRGDVPGYSVMLGGGIHMVDLMMWLTGDRPTGVVARGNQLVSRGTKLQFDDFSHAVFRFNGGMVGTVTANFGCVHRHQHVVRVFGTQATFLYDDMGPRIYSARDPGQPPEIPEQSALPPNKGALIGGFVGEIGGEVSVVRRRHELDVVAACIAAHQAAGSLRDERIEYDGT